MRRSSACAQQQPLALEQSHSRSWSPRLVSPHAPNPRDTSQPQAPSNPAPAPTPQAMTNETTSWNEPRKLELLKASNLLSTELVGIHDEDQT